MLWLLSIDSDKWKTNIPQAQNYAHEADRRRQLASYISDLSTAPFVSASIQHKPMTQWAHLREEHPFFVYVCA